jgi:hypothetical protein
VSSVALYRDEHDDVAEGLTGFDRRRSLCGDRTPSEQRALRRVKKLKDAEVEVLLDCPPELAKDEPYG